MPSNQSRMGHGSLSGGSRSRNRRREVERAQQGSSNGSNGEESNPKSQEDRAKRMLRKITNRAYNEGRN